MKYFVADAFTDTLFGGNPAGICFPERMLTDSLMQKIASENNLSETAFLIKDTESEDYFLRWFTPEKEIDLCGHATLASGFVILTLIEPYRNQVRFHTMSGILTVDKTDEGFTMDFPARPPTECNVPDGLAEALGAEILGTYRSRDLIVLLKDENAVRELNPNFEKLRAFSDYFGIVVTAKGESCDFVSRYFAPDAGIPEDSVTGSSHCSLVPFWSERLRKSRFTAKQLSVRGGTILCTFSENHVELCGQAVLYLDGELKIQ